MRTLTMSFICAICLCGCSLFGSARIIEIGVEDLYNEAYTTPIHVAITNIYAQPIEIRSITAEAGEVFYTRSDAVILDRGSDMELDVPFTPQYLMGSAVTVRMRYRMLDSPDGRWPGSEMEQTAEASAPFTLDLLPFSFPQARRSAGFMPTRYLYVKSRKTWLFESPDGTTAFINRDNVQTIGGCWCGVASKIEAARGAAVPVEFRLADAAIAEELGRQFEVTRTADALRVMLDGRGLIRFVRAVNTAGCTLAPGPLDGTLKARSG